MSYLNAIIQILIAIPKVFSLLKGLWDLIQAEQDKTKKEDQQKAIEELKKAKTEQELKDANKRITSNLP